MTICALNSTPKIIPHGSLLVECVWSKYTKRMFMGIIGVFSYSSMQGLNQGNVKNNKIEKTVLYGYCLFHYGSLSSPDQDPE